MTKKLTPLEALEIVKIDFLRDKEMGIVHMSELTLYCSIKKSLKALEIIKKKPQTLYLIEAWEDYDDYIDLAQDIALIEDIYSPEEFGLLKEVLKND